MAGIVGLPASGLSVVEVELGKKRKVFEVLIWSIRKK